MNSCTSLIGILFLTLVAANAQQLAPNAPKDKPVAVTLATVADFEKALASHIEEAQRTYPEARRRFLGGLPEKHHFFVTTKIKDPDGKFEQVFVYVAQIDPKRKVVTGRISNSLEVVRTFRRGQTISFPEAEVLDWTISRPDGTEEGNYVGKFLDEYQKR